MTSMSVCESDVSHFQNNFNYLNSVNLISDDYEMLAMLVFCH